MRLLALAALAILTAAASFAQRPIPYPVFTPPQVQRAIETGTRTNTGEPGPRYWQNDASYRIDALLDALDRTVRASGSITYTNNSPDALPFLVVRLNQNIHAPGVVRNRPAAVTGGVTLGTVRVNGTPLSETDGGALEADEYVVTGTVMTIKLARALAPGGTASLSFEWSYPVPPSTGAFRQGQDGEVFYLGYWYPQMAVYDDVYGWHTDPYMGNGEHYMNFADYEVNLDMPGGWLVWATGELQNADEVLGTETAARLARARTSDETVSIVGPDNRGSATQARGGRTTWRFKAERVRDFAVSTSAQYVWDATSARVNRDEGATRVLINAFYRPEAASWGRSAEFSKFTIEYLSELMYPYPWPHMTAVEGLIGGGMEYPMMTLIGGARSDQSLFGVTFHEIAHMWHPMIVGTNERSYTWMDEGFTSFLTNEGTAAFFDGSSAARPKVDAWARSRQSHYNLAGSGFAIEPMRHNDQFRVGAGTRDVDPVGGSARSVASYSTPAVLLHALEGISGRKAFFDAFRAYDRTWAFKHPLPTDFFNAMEGKLGTDLDWLWTPTLFETWTVDQAVGSVRTTAAGIDVTIDDKGLAPMPAEVLVTYIDGSTSRQHIPIETWLSGVTTTTLSFRPGQVKSVEIDPEGYIHDVDRTNNVKTL